MFSGFFFAKSVSEGGGTSMEYGKFPVAVKRPVVFGGAGFHICTCRSIRMYVPQIPALYYMIFFLHSAFIFISLLYLCEERV